MSLQRFRTIVYLVMAASIVTPFFVKLSSTALLGAPSDDMTLDYLTAVGWAAVLCGSIFLWPVPRRDRRLLIDGWLLKSSISLGFMLVYEYYYHFGIDAVGYFIHSDEITGLGAMGLGKGTANIMTLIWLHQHIFPHSYHAAKISCSLIGLLALYSFYRGFTLALGREEKRIFYAMLLLPSILFWSSILGKDPIVLLGIGAYFYGGAGIYRTGRARYLFWIAAGTFLAAFFRIWLGPILLAPLGVFAFARLKRVSTKIIVVGVVIAGFTFALRSSSAFFHIQTTEDFVSRSDTVLRAGGAAGGSGQQAEEIKDLRGMISFAPIGAFTALFRPLPGEINSAFGIAAGLENAAMLLLLFAAIARFRRADLRDPLVRWISALVLTWTTVYGFASYQNLGGAARFKLQILPMFFGLLLYLVRSRSSLPFGAMKKGVHDSVL